MTLLRKPGFAFSANRKWLYILLSLLGLAVTAAVGVGIQHWFLRAKVKPDLRVEVNLLKPDAFLNTQNLSQLPKDLLAAPILRDAASEELFFYYREDEGRLGLEGALRRMSFEHELGLSDRFIAVILDRPAQIAFWKSPNGRLGRWLMLVRREGLVPVLENLAKAALGDSQLRIAGTLPSPGHPQVFELSHGRRLKLYFASIGEQFAVFSDPGLLLSAGLAEAEKITRLLSAPQPAELWRQSFQLDASAHVHSFAVSANYLSLGYQALFPALRALRFDYDAQGWSAAVSASAPFPAASRVWSAVPDHPALCAALPVDPERVAALLSRLVSEDEAEDIADALEAPAAVCWYDKAKLYAPLVVIRKNSEDSLGSVLPNLFASAIGTHEAGTEQSPPAAAKPAKPGQDADADTQVEVLYHPPFGVSEDKQPNGTIWRREVSSPYGTRPSKDSPNRDHMRSGRYFTVALAEWKDALLFSPDAVLVDDAIAVLDGRYPALGDALPEQSETALAVYPEHLVNMVSSAVLESLPDQREPIFRANVSERLLPQLEKFKAGRLTRLPAPAGKNTWEAWQWSEQR
ncbi:MAG: DUF2138 family protein [Gammaproteobacteria bacterium]